MDPVVTKLCFSFLFSFLFTYYFIPIFIKIAYAYNIVDVPDGNIKQHHAPTPYLGGAALYLGFLGTLAMVFPFDNQFFLFLVGSTLLFYIGLVDDLISLSPLQKFAGQAIAVICFLRAGFYLKSHIFYNPWNIPISAFWMLLVINAFNLIDIMDGLAIVVAIFCAFNFLLIALFMTHAAIALLLAAMLGSFIAFFCFNKPRAQIYLGDAGSLFIGGLFSTVPFLFSWGNIDPFAYMIPIVVLAIPLLETCGLICIRTWKGIPFYQPSKDHFMHYLKRKGALEWHILLFVSVASTIIMCATLLFINQTIATTTLVAMGVIFLLSWIYVLFMRNLFFLK